MTAQIIHSKMIQHRSTTHGAQLSLAGPTLYQPRLVGNGSGPRDYARAHNYLINRAQPEGLSQLQSDGSLLHGYSPPSQDRGRSRILKGVVLIISSQEPEGSTLQQGDHSPLQTDNKEITPLHKNQKAPPYIITGR